MVSASKIGKMDSFPDGLVEKKNARVVFLSVGVEVFSPESVPSGESVPYWGGAESYRNDVPPREMPGGYLD